MLEVARYEGRKRVRGSLALTVGISLLVGLYLWMFPTITASIDLDEYVEAWPPALREAFGVESLGTIEGFLASELYAFVWVILLGIYLAYAAGAVVAGDVERDRMDILLSLPVTRTRLLLEKFAALLVPVAVLNALVPAVVYAGVLAIGESISLADLVALHLLSVPYLLTTAGVGLLCSVAVDRASIAQRIAMAVVFGLFLVDSVVTGTDYSWLGAVAPSRYFDPSRILVHGEYDVGGAAVLTAAAVGLVALSAAWFSRKNVY